MSRTFEIENRDYYNEKEYLFRRKQVTIEPGVSVLVGCNGTGKSTLIHIIKEDLEEKEINFTFYDNLIHGGSNAKSKAGFYGDMTHLMSLVCSSEGEGIVSNMGKFVYSVGKYLRKHKDSKEVWILLDAVDSGLSVDNVIEIKELFKLIIDDHKDKDIYIVISANEYELAREEQCFDVYGCKYITFEDYEDYRKFIIKSRERKDKRYKTKE